MHAQLSLMQGRTALHHAAMNGHGPVIRWLLANGDHVHTTDYEVRLQLPNMTICTMAYEVESLMLMKSKEALS